MEAEYDATQAKFCASLLWFVCRISENEECNVPPEITSPLDSSTKTGVLVRPAVVDYLTTGVMYFKVASKIYERPFKSFWDLLHYLSKNGIYAMNEKEETITDKDLQKKHPFKMHAHISIMDSILQAYIENTATLQNFINSIKKFDSFNASREMPFDIEDAAVLWLNKLNAANTAKHLLKQKSPLPSPQDVSSGVTKIRIRKDQVVETKVFPSVKSLHKALHDGRSLLSILLFYYWNALKIEDIKLSSLLTNSEKLANIELFRSLCAANVCTSVFALRIEDFYYASDQLKNNFLALLCEILSCVESLQEVVMEEKPQEQALPESDAGSMGETKAAHHQHHPHQPLLSKRSKKQFAQFEGDRHILEKKAAKSDELQIDDYELKQSHIVPPIHGEERRTAPVSSSFAWADSKKPSKISLEFKPTVSSSTRPSIKGVSTDVSTGESAEPDITSYRDQPDVVSSQYSENKSHSNFEHEPSPNPRDSSLIHQSLTNCTVGSGPELTGSCKKGMTSMYQLMCEPDLSSIEVPHDVVSETKVESPGTSEKEIEDDEEDALSTITETSEPGTPGATGPGAFKSAQQSELSPHHQPPMHAHNKEFTGSSYIIQNGGTVENAIASGLPIISTRQTDASMEVDTAAETDKLKYVDLTSSHEVSGMEKEKTILETFLDRNSVEVLDNFMQRTSVNIEENHQEQQQKILQPSQIEVPASTMNTELETQNTMEASLGQTNVNAAYNIDKETSKYGQPMSYKKGVSKSFEPNTNMEAFFDATNVHKSFSTGQHVDIPTSTSFTKNVMITREPNKPESPLSTNVKKSFNSGLGSPQESDVEPVQSLRATGIDPVKSSETKDKKCKVSTTIRLSVSQPDNGAADPSSSVEVGEAKREGERVSGILQTQDERKAKFFDNLNISYEHWPFTKKKQDTNTKVMQENGENLYIEQLDIFRNNRNSQSSPNLTSWLKSSNEQARLSLEEREERLRKIQERRLQYMGSGITTTWSNISRQHEQQKKLENDIKCNKGENRKLFFALNHDGDFYCPLTQKFFSLLICTMNDDSGDYGSFIIICCFQVKDICVLIETSGSNLGNSLPFFPNSIW